MAVLSAFKGPWAWRSLSALSLLGDSVAWSGSSPCLSPADPLAFRFMIWLLHVSPTNSLCLGQSVLLSVACNPRTLSNREIGASKVGCNSLGRKQM